ncbi:MAG: divalent-cation tolerance protein CutA [Lentisphaerae bacterium]|nr:divalent-cation tolerance protein CutA [Lentisphaerota bacterium]
MLKLIQTTVAEAQQAEQLARRIIERSLAACVQMVPIRSTYRWQGAIEQSAEVLLLMKTSEARATALMQFLADEHPYEVPEIVATDLTDVSEPYAAWVADQTEKDGVHT